MPATARWACSLTHHNCALIRLTQALNPWAIRPKQLLGQSPQPLRAGIVIHRELPGACAFKQCLHLRTRVVQTCQGGEHHRIL